MNAIHIFALAALLLMLNGCDKRAPSNKTETAASAVPAVTANEVTPEEKFAETKKKAEAGDVEAQVSIGLMYNKGEGISQDATKAETWFQKAAAQGNPRAQYNLGLMYHLGEGIAKDVAKAMAWYQKAAAQGYGNAQYNIGVMYDNGDGIPKDSAKAMEWYQKAATQGNTAAMRSLGDKYLLGDSIPKDTTKAVAWFHKAAEGGGDKAQFVLGIFYAEGMFLDRNVVKAVEQLSAAAKQGHADAQYELSQKYANGEGVPKSAVKAFEWAQKSAAQGHSDAQYILGVTYARTDAAPFGITFDPARAYAWFNLASAQGNKNAKQLLVSFETVLTPAQRAEGQRLASNWKKGDVILASSDNPLDSASPDAKPIRHSTGTAFAVSNSGHALTNYHVIKACDEVRIEGREGVIKVITSDSVNDLALLQLAGRVNDIASLNPEPGKLRQGEDIIVFGYPLEWALSSGGNLTPGSISALTGLGNNTNQIQITAPIQLGSSGSPVMDKKGNVVGVVSMKLDDGKMARATGQVGQNVNFAVNGLTVRAFLDANQVPYKTGGGLFSREQSNADIAEEARKWTILVECWK